MRKITITTTNNIEGRNITHYFDPIAAHVVLGTNVLSEFKASFTDFWGGRSTTYEKRLRLLYEQATGILKRKAESLNANAIIGMKMDIDEISEGSNKMFMITAVGTPVIVVSADAKNDKNAEPMLDGHLVGNKVKAKLLLQGNLHPVKLYSEDNIAFFQETGYPEFARLVLDGIKYFIKEETRIAIGSAEAERFVTSLKRYFGSVETDSIADIVLGEFKENAVPEYLKVIAQIAAEYHLLGYEPLIKLMKSTNLNIAKYGMWLSVAERPGYSVNDIPSIQKLMNTVTTEFKPRGEVSMKKKLLSGEKEVWTCTCGKTNDIEQTYCSGCDNDIYGFARNEQKPLTVIELMKQQIAVIEELSLTR